MPTTTYNDLAVVHQYLDRITSFIQSLVQDENRAIVLACQVFEECQEMNRTDPFATEQNREAWLIHRGRELALGHLKYVSREKIKEKAIGAAIHDSL